MFLFWLQITDENISVLMHICAGVLTLLDEMLVRETVAGLAGLVRNFLFDSLLQLVFIIYSDNQFDASKLIVFFFI